MSLRLASLLQLVKHMVFRQLRSQTVKTLGMRIGDKAESMRDRGRDKNLGTVQDVSGQLATMPIASTCISECL